MIWEQEIMRIAEDFNRRMSVIIAIEWVAFGLSMVALAWVVISEIRERRARNDRVQSSRSRSRT